MCVSFYRHLTLLTSYCVIYATFLANWHIISLCFQFNELQLSDKMSTYVVLLFQCPSFFPLIYLILSRYLNFSISPYLNVLFLKLEIEILFMGCLRAENCLRSVLMYSLQFPMSCLSSLSGQMLVLLSLYNILGSLPLSCQNINSIHYLAQIILISSILKINSYGLSTIPSLKPGNVSDIPLLLFVFSFTSV